MASRNEPTCGRCSHFESCIFSELSSRDLPSVSLSLQRIRFDGRAQRADLPAIPGYYILCEGAGAVIVSDLGGKRVATEILKAGDSLWVSSSWSAGEYGTFIRSFAQTEIRFIEAKEFSELERTYPSIARRALEKAEAQAQHLRERLIEIAYAGSKTRVAMLILELEESQLQDMRFRQEELAEMAGISREMCNKRLREFVDHGYIALKRHKIVVLDRAGLNRAGQRWR